jgi:transposase
MYSVDEIGGRFAGIRRLCRPGFGRFSYFGKCGYSKIGEPLLVQKEKPRTSSTSVLACASKEKWESYKICNGSVNREAFCEFIRELNLPAGSVIMMDNASIHKGEQVNNVFKEKNYIRLYVPPYSPWFNPIEKCFSIVKRNFPKTENIKQSFLDMNTESHFVPFFRHVLSCYGVNDVDAQQTKLLFPILSMLFFDENTQPLKKVKRQRVLKTCVESTSVKTMKTKNLDGTVTVVKTTTTVKTTTRT